MRNETRKKRTWLSPLSGKRGPNKEALGYPDFAGAGPRSSKSHPEQPSRETEELKIKIINV